MGCVSQLHSIFIPIVIRSLKHAQLAVLQRFSLCAVKSSGFRSQQTSVNTPCLALDRTSSVLHSFFFASKSEY